MPSDRPSLVFSLQNDEGDERRPWPAVALHNTLKRCFRQFTTMSDDKEDSPRVTNTIREAILHSTDLLKTKVAVEGKVTVLDPDLGRMDVARDGAKLIVRLAANEIAGGIAVGDEVVVMGVLRKEQRRTFLQATQVQKK